MTTHEVLTPAGLSTPEGAKKVEEIIRAQQEAILMVARIVSNYDYAIHEALVEAGQEDIAEEIEEALKAWKYTNNDVLKAVAGRL